MKKKLLISFSGGRTSAFMCWWLLNVWPNRDKYEIIVVFANTGKEKPQTLDFVEKCDKYFGLNVVWIEAVTNPKNRFGVLAKIVSFETADRTGKPFEDVIAKHGIPNQASPHCSRQLKQEAIRAYARSIGWVGRKYRTAIGIRADEPERLNWETAKKKYLIYPLAQWIRVNKSDINLFWSKQPFDLELKSYEGNCDFCWKKSLRKLMTIAKDNPELLGWWQEMQKKYGNFISPSRKSKEDLKLPLNFFRNQMTVEDIVEESKFPFTPAIDDSKLIDQYKQMSLWSEELDGNNGCSESCEAF